MRKMILVLMLAATVVFPTVVFAGQGATTFYGIFHNTYGSSPLKTMSRTWIWANNSNNYDATLKITYYNYSGIAYNSEPITHTIAPNATASWNPGDDLNWNPQDSPLSGNYVVKVTDGSITMRSNILSYAGDTLNDPNYSVGDFIGAQEAPVHTITSTNLCLAGFNYYDPDADNVALDPGERNARIHIVNPSDDQDATIHMRFHDKDGNAVEVEPHDSGDLTSFTFTLNPHQTRVITPGFFFASPNSNTTYNVNFDVTKGSVIGNYLLYECTQGNEGTTNYRRFGGALTKQLIIQ